MAKPGDRRARNRVQPFRDQYPEIARRMAYNHIDSAAGETIDLLAWKLADRAEALDDIRRQVTRHTPNEWHLEPTAARQLPRHKCVDAGCGYGAV